MLVLGRSEEDLGLEGDRFPCVIVMDPFDLGNAGEARSETPVLHDHGCEVWAIWSVSGPASPLVLSRLVLMQASVIPTRLVRVSFGARVPASMGLFLLPLSSVA